MLIRSFIKVSILHYEVSCQFFGLLVCMIFSLIILFSSLKLFYPPYFIYRLCRHPNCCERILNCKVSDMMTLHGNFKKFQKKPDLTPSRQLLDVKLNSEYVKKDITMIFYDKHSDGGHSKSRNGASVLVDTLNTQFFQ